MVDRPPTADKPPRGAPPTLTRKGRPASSRFPAALVPRDATPPDRREGEAGRPDGVRAPDPGAVRSIPADFAPPLEVRFQRRQIDLDTEARALRNLDHAIRADRRRAPEVPQRIRRLVVLEPRVRHRRMTPIARQ